MNAGATAETIYIGAAIEVWSERLVLERLHASLTADGKPFVLLANFQLGGRQIDCIVVTERRVVVVEVKASTLPIRGQVNGDWARLHPSGEWQHYTNGYRQALSQKERLVDAMRKRGDIGDHYPDAAVVFAKPLPKDSSLTSGDFKVSVTDLERFDPRGAGDRRNPWSIDDWRLFALSSSLRGVSLGEVSGGEVLAHAFTLVRDYQGRIASELDRDGRLWLPENEEQRTELISAADSAPGLYIQGPSGCGKTLAVRWLASQLTRANECILFVAAKDFDGSWGTLLKRELALITDISVGGLFKASRATGCSLRIIVDGINEVGPSRDEMLRGLRALARRYDARVIVTGQSGAPDQLAALTTLAVAPPSLDLKERIAARKLGALGRRAVSALLQAVTSGFEAAMVAEVGAEMAPDASRQLLVDQFVRHRLGGAQRAGSAGLRLFAKRLIEATSFSMNETGFDELMIEHGLVSNDIDQLFAAPILVRRGGRVSFAHEILFNASAAFAFAHLAPQAGAKFAILLGIPALEPIATDIVSVIEDPAVVQLVLETTPNSSLLFESAQGLAGPVAGAVASSLLSNAESAIAAEIAGLRLAIKLDPRPSIDWDEDSLWAWDDAGVARIEALARTIAAGGSVDSYLALCQTMDARLLEERERLFETAKAAGVNGLRSEGFSLAYFGFGRQCGFTRLTRAFSSGMFDLSDKTKAHAPLDMLTLTSGQLHFYLERRRVFSAEDGIDDMAAGLTCVVRERFRWEPYHVKLAILHAAGFVRWASSERVEALLEAIQAIDANREHLFVSTAIVDALRFLGGLDDSAEDAREGIKREFDRATGNDSNDDVFDLALTLYVATFDHPFSGVYAEEFNSLSVSHRHVLIRRALSADSARTSMSLSWLLRDLAALGDATDRLIMERFARLPDPRNGFPQEEWAAFALATRFLGRHDLELPMLVGENDASQALIHVRSLVYAADGGARRLPPGPVWAALGTLRSGVVIGCLAEMEAALREHDWLKQDELPRLSLMTAYRQESLTAARRFLDDGGEAEHFHFAYGRERGHDLAFAIIGQFGDRSDLERLRRLANGARFARSALDALRKLDAA